MKRDGIKTSGGTRVEREMQHGRYLAAEETETQWGWGTPAGQHRMRRRAAWIAAEAGLGPQTHALEIGCGTGLFTERFAETGCRLLAVDLAAELLERARRRVERFPQVRFELRPFEECAAIGPFDAVVGSSVLHHLDVSLSLRRMFELLKPGGKIVFAEPNLRNPQVFLERKFRRFFPYVSPDETAFLRGRLAVEAKHAGFVEVRITPFDWLHPAIPAALIPAVSAAGRMLESIPLLREFSGSLLLSGRKPAA